MTRRALAGWTAVIVVLVGFYVVTGSGDALLLGIAVFCLLLMWLLGVAW